MMLSILMTTCDRLRRRHSITRRQRRQRLISGRITELKQLEVELEHLILRTDSPVKENSALIRMFYADLEEAQQHFTQQRYRAAKKSRSSAKATLICIKRNISAMQTDPNVRPVIN